MSKKHIDLLIKNKISDSEFINNINLHMSNSEISHILNNKEYCIKLLIQSLDHINKCDITWNERAALFITIIIEDLFKISTKNYKISTNIIINLFDLKNQLYLYNYLCSIDKNHINEYLLNLVGFRFNELISSQAIEQNNYISMQFQNILNLKTTHTNQQDINGLIKKQISIHKIERKIYHF